MFLLLLLVDHPQSVYINFGNSNWFPPVKSCSILVEIRKRVNFTPHVLVSGVSQDNIVY